MPQWFGWFGVVSRTAGAAGGLGQAVDTACMLAFNGSENRAKTHAATAANYFASLEAVITFIIHATAVAKKVGTVKIIIGSLDLKLCLAQ